MNTVIQGDVSKGMTSGMERGTCACTDDGSRPTGTAMQRHVTLPGTLRVHPRTVNRLITFCRLRLVPFLAYKPAI